MYKLILSDEHSEILKQAFLSYYKIRQNDWTDFIKDIEANDKYIHLFEEAFETACPDYKQIYKIIRKNNEIIKIKGFNISDDIFPKLFEDELILQDLQEIKDTLYVSEEFIRIRMGQFFDFTNDVATNGWSYDNRKPDSSKKFNEYIERRNASRDMFDEAFIKTVKYLRKKNKKIPLAQDLYDVLKYQIYLDTPTMHDLWTVYSNHPINHSGTKSMPKIKII